MHIIHASLENKGQWRAGEQSDYSGEGGECRNKVTFRAPRMPNPNAKLDTQTLVRDT